MKMNLLIHFIILSHFICLYRKIYFDGDELNDSIHNFIHISHFICFYCKIYFHEDELIDSFHYFILSFISSFASIVKFVSMEMNSMIRFTILSLYLTSFVCMQNLLRWRKMQSLNSLFYSCILLHLSPL